MAERRIYGSNAEQKATVFLGTTNSANQEAQAKITNAYIDIHLAGCIKYHTCNFEITNDIASGISKLKVQELQAFLCNMIKRFLPLQTTQNVD
jgi:hypothetical protein